MTIQKGIVTVVATGALFVSTLTPLALADTTISGNGAVSDNTVTMNNNSSTTVNQNNNANITNTVDSSANTGGNHADFNTGGSTAINTGDASNNTWVSTQANANVANVQGAGSNNGTGAIAITGNGAFSDNSVAARNNSNSTTVNQNNNAQVTNTVRNNANTGDNSGSFNTGGDTTILTGNAGSNTGIATRVNANVASVDGFGGNGFGGSALIAGNGAESDNAITLSNRGTTTLNQNNNAYITNTVTNHANTGYNTADFNTGGGVLIGTGNAYNNTNIQNSANFNWASLNACGCTSDGNGNVAIIGNGAFSHNSVRDNFGNRLATYQNNYADIANNVRNNQSTGYNSSDFNTSDPFWGYGSPSFLFTGGAQNNTGVSTEANKNIIGNGSLNWGGTGLDLSFNMNDLLNQLHI